MYPTKCGYPATSNNPCHLPNEINENHIPQRSEPERLDFILERWHPVTSSSAVFSIQLITKLSKEVRPRKNLKTQDIRWRQLCYSCANLAHFGRETRCFDLFNSRAQTAYCPCTSAKLPTCRSNSVAWAMVEHASFQQPISAVQSIQPKTRISLFTTSFNSLQVRHVVRRIIVSYFL